MPFIQSGEVWFALQIKFWGNDAETLRTILDDHIPSNVASPKPVKFLATSLTIKEYRHPLAREFHTSSRTVFFKADDTVEAEEDPNQGD